MAFSCSIIADSPSKERAMGSPTSRAEVVTTQTTLPATLLVDLSAEAARESFVEIEWRVDGGIMSRRAERRSRRDSESGACREVVEAEEREDVEEAAEEVGEAYGERPAASLSSTISTLTYNHKP
jgi:hypothetical protein